MPIKMVILLLCICNYGYACCIVLCITHRSDPLACGNPGAGIHGQCWNTKLGHPLDLRAINCILAMTNLVVGEVELLQMPGAFYRYENRGQRRSGLSMYNR